MANNKTKVTINEALRKDLKTYGARFSAGMASRIAEELNIEAVFAISEFYRDYEPKHYERHYYNFIGKTSREYYRNPHNTMVRGGVELNPEWMDDLYRDSTEEVFDLVLHGFHGAPLGKNNIPVMSPTPLDIIEAKRDEIVSNIESYRKYGEKWANTGSHYETLQGV